MSGWLLAMALGPGCDLVMPTNTVQQLVGPWQRSPLRPAADLVTDMDAGCRADEVIADEMELVVVDARGGQGRVLMYYAGETGGGGRREASCDGTILQDGTTQSLVSRTASGEFAPPDAEGELRVAHESGAAADPGDPGSWFAVMGQAGPGVERVIAKVPGHPRIDASMSDGWFAVWWPAEPGGPYRLVALNSVGVPIGEFDSD